MITRLSDDSLDGDTDGLDPSQNVSGVSPLAIYSGTLVVRGVEARSAGLRLGGGVVNVEDTTFRDGAGVSGLADAVRLDRVELDATAGGVELNAARATVSRSRFQAGSLSLHGSGTYGVHDNTFAHGAISNDSADLSFYDNRSPRPTSR